MIAAFLTGFGFTLGVATALVIVWPMVGWLNRRKDHG